MVIPLTVAQLESRLRQCAGGNDRSNYQNSYSSSHSKKYLNQSKGRFLSLNDKESTRTGKIHDHNKLSWPKCACTHDKDLN